MYILNKPIALLGIAVAALSTVFCPFVKPPLMASWNLYQTDVSLFFITIAILAIATLFYVLRRIRAYQIISYVFLVWTVLGLSVVYFKVNNFFGIKFFDGILAKTIHIKWGWAVLILSALVMILSVRKVKEIK